MSRRFGRNQRRAMREQIANADAQAAQRLQMAEYSRQEAKYLRDELDYAKEVAGSMSVIFPATNTIDGGTKKPFMSIAVAAMNMGFHLDGVELDPSMYEAALARVESHGEFLALQPSIEFGVGTDAMVQEALL